ncbi:MAG TPA: protease modulator HflC [Acidobacteriota bacterium]|jgi:membrane protease subunit HflC|nr:protease modulator HflC [Acidobacteriota bacterium]|tara:strand:+ start:6792 stop:7724 length:933 start_codon:yes stop_codon:yes gene_type:complete
MNAKTIAIIIIGLTILTSLSTSVYVTNEAQQVIITQFGRPVGEVVTDAGLHIKVPFIQAANYFEKRFLEWDGVANQVPTRDKRFIWVDTYARWRISNPLLFFQRLRDERGAETRISAILDGETRNAVARHDLVEVVRNSNREPDEILLDAEEETAILEQIQLGREAITREILEAAQSSFNDLGIEILDVRFKRINYVEEVQVDVFQRMIAERQRIASRYRSEGEGETARIDGERERELQRIQSLAYREAEEIRGQADGEATRIYAAAYNRDEDFYAFIKSLETYELTADPSSILILTTDSELLRFVKSKQ